MADNNDNETSKKNSTSINDAVCDKKKLISNWWDQTTELYSQLIDSDFLEKENLHKLAVDKKEEIFNDINGISNDIVSNIFEQVFGLPSHNPTRLNEILPVIVGPLKNPTELQYMKCLEKDGDIVWDTKGQFNCLFPETYLKERGLQDLQLSKEQVAKDTNHKKFGIFFNDYSKYLTWKYENKKNITKDPSTETTDIDAFKNKLNEDYQYYSSYIRQYTDEKGNLEKEKITETKNQTPEGLKVRIERIKFPSDGSSPKTEIEEKLIPKK